MTTDMTRKCSWCGTVLHQGDPGAPTTHGICPECAAKLEARQ